MSFLLQCVEGVAELAASQKKILTIFSLYTFSHSQGHELSSVAAVETLLRKVRISYPNMPPRCKAPVKRATSRLAREVTVL